MIVIAAIGVAVATYLTVVHYAGLTVFCTTQHNSCAQVQASVYSKVVGVPVALLGLIGYVLILGTLLAPDAGALARRDARPDAVRLRLQRVPHLPRGLHAQGRSASGASAARRC